MLLRHTTAVETPRSSLTVNPAKTCQPIGAMYAALGIHRCLPHSHGSQGCCSYHRSQLTRHTKEPVMAATSSFTEGSSVFGGQANLLAAIETIFAAYDPDVIAVHTTCLSETIGDDVHQIIGKATVEKKIPPGKVVFHANTPSYVGSHVTGYANMVKAMVETFVQPKTSSRRQVTVIPGWVEPADLREIKRFCTAFELPVVMMPDQSNVLDAGLTGDAGMYPVGGVTVDALRSIGDSLCGVALGPSAAGPAARHLEAKAGIHTETLELPIGLRATDRLIDHLRKISGKPVPAEIVWERQRLVDLISDMHQYFYGKTVALWGDPDQLVSLSEFLIDLNMVPKYVVTGTPGRSFERRMKKALGDEAGASRYAQGMGADLMAMHQWIKQEKVDLLIGGTHGKYISRDEGIPMVRHGFPIVDRIGHQYFPTAGYKGAMRLCEQILDALLGKKDTECLEESFELVL